MTDYGSTQVHVWCTLDTYQSIVTSAYGLLCGQLAMALVEDRTREGGPSHAHHSSHGDGSNQT